jgi:hypothetical protein
VLPKILKTASSENFLIASALTPKTPEIFSRVASSTSSLCSILEMVCWLTPSFECQGVLLDASDFADTTDFSADVGFA